MNSITKKQYDAIKNDTSYSVVPFENGRRTLTYKGLNILNAVEEILRNQKLGRESLLIKNLPAGELSWDRADYNKYVLKKEV